MQLSVMVKLNKSPEKYIRIGAVCLFTIFFFFISRIYIHRIGAFGCSDQCHIFVSAYFMLKGKHLYSEIFFNHQMIMPYISYVLQYLLHPNSIYALIVSHHIFVIISSFLMNIVLIIRFGFIGLLFALFFETTKYYLHGNLFLPESLTVYPLVYLLGIVLSAHKKKNISKFDAIFAPLLTWFVVFLREPYIPVAILLFLGTLFYSNKKNKIIACSIFSALTILIIFTVDLPSYLFDVIMVNSKTASTETSNFIKSLLYPFFIFIEGKQTFFREILIFFDAVFIISILYFIVCLKKGKMALYIFAVLGLAAIRYVPPGQMYFEAFHLLPWYALFLASTLFLLKECLSLINKNKLYYFFGFYFLIFFLFVLFSPKSFLSDSFDTQREFSIGYAPYFAYGQVIKTLSNKNNTLFLDVWDDLIYLESGLDSSYRYSLFIPVMKNIPRFELARLEMFRRNPPDFYYSRCNENDNYSFMPTNIQNMYSQLLKNGKNSCLSVKKTVLENAKLEKRTKIAQFGFSIP